MSTHHNDVLHAREPKSKGMTFLRFERIPLNKVTVRPNKNTSRVAGLDQKNVDDFVELMENGLYEPEYHIPPVVTEGPKGTYYIESGEHRYNAHLVMDDNGWPDFKTFYAAVVTFEDAGGFPADYWREVWVTKENTQITPFVRKAAKKEDIASSVANLVNSRIINKDEKSISTAIQNMGVNPNTGVFQTIKSLVWKNLGNGAKVVQGIHDKRKKAFIKEYAQHYNLNREPIGATFKELDDVDYDWRTLKKLYKLYVKNPKNFYQTVVIAHTNGADPQKVRKIRDRKKTLLARFAADMKQFVRTMETSDVPFEVNILWMPQLDGEASETNPYLLLKA